MMILAALVSYAALGCGSSSISVQGPSDSKCPVTVTNSMPSAPAAGGSGTLTIATNRDCTWAVASGASWIVITAGSSGQGDGAASFQIAANTEFATRRGTIEVNSTQIAVAQDAACRFTVSAASTPVSAQGGALTITVQTGASCGWNAASHADWIAITAGQSGAGNGSVTIAADANSGGPRSGTVTVAGQTVTISQAAAPAPPPNPPPNCDLTIAPASQTFQAGGGTGSISVAVVDGCAWTAVSSAPWITITSGAAGSGAGQVHFSAGANSTTASRQGTITIGGKTFTVIEGGVNCSYAIQPASQSIAAGGGNLTVAVTAPGACTWSAHANVPWIAIAQGASGSGNGSVVVTVSANSGASRTGTVSIADQTFSVTQAAAPCSYTIAPTTAAVPASGGAGSISVTTDAACAWSAVSNATWLTVTTGPSGTGNGTVGYAAAANVGPQRTGTITIAGQMFTVTQDASMLH